MHVAEQGTDGRDGVQTDGADGVSDIQLPLQESARKEASQSQCYNVFVRRYCLRVFYHDGNV
jgi:hypothetical protein